MALDSGNVTSPTALLRLLALLVTMATQTACLRLDLGAGPGEGRAHPRRLGNAFRPQTLNTASSEGAQLSATELLPRKLTGPKPAPAAVTGRLNRPVLSDKQMRMARLAPNVRVGRLPFSVFLAALRRPSSKGRLFVNPFAYLSQHVVIAG